MSDNPKKPPAPPSMKPEVKQKEETAPAGDMPREAEQVRAAWSDWVPREAREKDAPAFFSKGSAGADIRVHIPGSGPSGGGDPNAAPPKTIIVNAGCQVSVPTGLHLEIPVGYVGLLFLRSGAAKEGLSLANGVGVIDSDYRGEVGVMVYNRSKEDIVINNGDRLAQLVVVPVPEIVFKIVPQDKLSVTPRGQAGFGSTGKN
jgi:dUTP pyrophosphatase